MQHLLSLIGQRLIRVEFEVQSQWRFHFSKGAEIRPGTTWRIIAIGTIQTSSEDHGQKFGMSEPIDAAALSLDVIAGSVVSSVEVVDGTLDLFVQFDNGTKLEIIPFSSGFESWQYTDADGRHIVAQGGGEIVSWPPKIQ